MSITWQTTLFVAHIFTYLGADRGESVHLAVMRVVQGTQRGMTADQRLQYIVCGINARR